MLNDKTQLERGMQKLGLENIPQVINKLLIYKELLIKWNKSLFHPSFLLSTWFYTGLLPLAPGTFGSIAALPFAWLIIESVSYTHLRAHET